MKQAEKTRVRFATRAAHPFWKSAFVSIALAAAAAGCGEDTGGGGGETETETKNDGGTTKSDAGTVKNDAGTAKADAGSSGSVDDGKSLADDNACTSCHGDDYSGAGFYPNITPDDDTGIGSWTDTQIKTAITTGVDDEGGKLCSLMQRYKFSATEQNNIVAYLRSLDAVSNEITTACPTK